MCVLCFKFDGSTLFPHQFKSRIVVLGNAESTPWTKAECYAPTVPQPIVMIFASEAVSQGSFLKQTDFNNAFVQATLPADENTICKPPKACPHSFPDTVW